MTVFIYARVSTLDQNTDLQKQALKKAYPEGKYLEEKASGTSLKKRQQLNMILEIIDEGDKLVVWKLDRLARDMHDLMVIMKHLDEKGAALEILDQKIDTAQASGKAFLQMLGVFAEFETNLRKERQKAGIAAAQAKGKHLGRRPKLTNKQVNEVKAKSQAGKNPSELAREYGVSRASIYRIMAGNEMQAATQSTPVA